MAYIDTSTAQKALGNYNIGVSGGTLCDDDQLDYLIDMISAKINLKLRVSADISSEPEKKVLGSIVVDLLTMHVLRFRLLKEQNEVEGVSAYFTAIPDFTEQHLRTLSEIRESISKTTWVVDTDRGVVLR